MIMKKNTHIQDLDDFLTMLNCNLEKIEKREVKEPSTELKENVVKKKITTDKKSKYILICGFVACIIVFLYFFSSFNYKKEFDWIENPFDGQNIDMYDFAEGQFLK